MKRSVIGILAHVDAGKTTLSEAMLFSSGALRNLGRVDHGDASLDTFSLERQRGITIFSKQAILEHGDLHATLLDTPGHVDFSAEMERTLDVLDCAILVVSASAGVQSHTHTVWKLLRQRNIPTFLFVNKMDLPGADRAEIIRELQRNFGQGVVELTADAEELALGDEILLSEFLETGGISQQAIRDAIGRGTLFPVWFGAALRLEGVDAFLDGLARYAPECPQKEDFGAKVFKIARDAQGQRETHLKVTGGRLRVREAVPGTGEKVTQLRVYSGEKFRTVDEALPGDVAAAVGLSGTRAGQGLGAEGESAQPRLTPVLTYRTILPEGCDLHTAYQKFRQLEEEEPQLHVVFDEAHQELRVQIMGAVQLEILQAVLQERFGLAVSFGQGSILYRETIAAPVEGVGHYEPLRHYAEVHLLLEPLEPGSGLEFASTVSENELDRNYQHLILTHLAEKTHLGVLTGSPITDMKITLAAGKAHLKHTEGGDFRQATYRAVRQGLMQAEPVLLEPWYEFRLELPQACAGRAMTDFQRMGAELGPMESRGDRAVLGGIVPVRAVGTYPGEIAAYTRGSGVFTCSFHGYAPCQNQDEVAAEIGYQPEADLDNTPDSVFCVHGAGCTVKWSEVFTQMHLPPVLKPEREEREMETLGRRYRAMAATDQELLRIFERTYGPVKRDKNLAMREPKSEQSSKPYRASPIPTGPEYVLVDGYNLIFSWDSLKALAQENLELARDRLIDLMRSYQTFRGCPVILVFDAYKVKGNPGSEVRYGDLSVVYTKEAQTADAYIEKLSYDLGKSRRVRVATSDGLEQIIILGHGALRVPSRIFQSEVERVMEAIRDCLSE